MDKVRKELLRSWLTKANHDLQNARIVGAADEGPLDTAIYHCQQTAEKAVKAFLIHLDITPEKTHDIRKLMLEAAVHEPRFDDLLDTAAALTPYAWQTRYPDDLAETYPTREEFDEAMQHAQAIYNFVLSLLPADVRP